MKYTLSDLRHFELHDSEWTVTSIGDGRLTAAVTHLNVHKDALDGDYAYDREIGEATVTFWGFAAVSLEPYRPWREDQNGECAPCGWQVIYRGAAAEAELMKRGAFEALSHELDRENGIYTLAAWANEPCGEFSLCFTFDRVTVEWDAFGGYAWYAGHIWHELDRVLVTPDGEHPLRLGVTVHELPFTVYSAAEPHTPCTRAVLVMDKQTYVGEAAVGDIEGAVADLNDRLPDGVWVK